MIDIVTKIVIYHQYNYDIMNKSVHILQQYAYSHISPVQLRHHEQIKVIYCNNSHTVIYHQYNYDIMNKSRSYTATIRIQSYITSTTTTSWTNQGHILQQYAYSHISPVQLRHHEQIKVIYCNNTHTVIYHQYNYDIMNKSRSYTATIRIQT